MQTQSPLPKPPAARRTFAAALAVWLGGVCCLICVAACGAEVRASEADSCSEHSCCHANRIANDRVGIKGVPAGEVAVCCVRGGQAAALPGEVHSTKSVAAQTRNVLPPLIESRAGRRTIALSRSHVPDRGGTYLRWCVFLI